MPIVFVIVADPVGAGFVDSWRGQAKTPPDLPFEYGMGAKWLELLKQIAPGVTRVAVFGSHPGRRGRPVRRDPIRGTIARCGVSPSASRDAGEIERAIAAFAHSPNGGLIVTASALHAVHPRSNRHA